MGGRQPGLPADNVSDGRTRHNGEADRLEEGSKLQEDLPPGAVHTPGSSLPGHKEHPGMKYSMVGTRLLQCGKDTFYNFQKSDSVDWRGILAHVASHVIGKFSIREDRKKKGTPICLIADDTDMEKTGRRIEDIGKIFSHVSGRCVLGFNDLVLCWTDGLSQVILDHSMKSEMGKKNDQGISRRDAERRYSRERAEGSHARGRFDEQFESKVDSLIEMIKRAIRRGIKFDYLLADSWFSNAKLIKFIKSRHIGCNYLGMIRINAKTKYTFEGKAMTASEIVGKLKKRKEVKYCRSMRYHYAYADVVFQGMKLRLFFYITSKKEGWNALITTDRSLDAKSAYRIYSMRWAIEVCFADMKRLLRFGKNQSRDFSAQIGSVTISCIQYNILSCVKRFESYETMGGFSASSTCPITN